VVRPVAPGGDRPSGLDPNEALCALLKARSIYEDVADIVAPYCAKELKVLCKDPWPKRIQDVCPAKVIAVFANPERYIRKSDDQIVAEFPDGSSFHPYWGEILRQTSMYVPTSLSAWRGWDWSDFGKDHVFLRVAGLFLGRCGQPTLNTNQMLFLCSPGCFSRCEVVFFASGVVFCLLLFLYRCGVVFRVGQDECVYLQYLN
jgi:hypothetical protein